MMNYPKMYNRDEIFFRLGTEKSNELLDKIKFDNNPNFQDDLGISYLHRACQSHYVEAVKLLLEMGANPNIRENRGGSPIMSALGRINENNNSILKLMLSYGLDLTATEGDMTLKQKIESLHNDEFNKIISDYCQK